MSIRGTAGQDILIINNRILNDFAMDDPIVLDYPNELVEYNRYKNGNTIVVFKSQGTIVNLSLKLMIASDDDKFLNTFLNSQITNPASFVMLTAQFIKNASNPETGDINQITYNLGAGVFSKLINAKENVSTDPEQAAAVYNLKFAGLNRSIT